MNAEYREALLRCETDVDAGLFRLSGDEEIYEICLAMFLQDQSMNDLDRAIDRGEWDEAFTAIHALKGVAGNMGFVPLFQAASEMVILIRSGRTDDLSASRRQLKQCYDDISAAIRKHC